MNTTVLRLANRATELLATTPPLHLALVGAVVVAILVAIVWLIVDFRRTRRRRRRAKPTSTLIPRMASSIPQSSPEALQGGLRHMPLPDLLQFLAQGRRTGTLEISSGRRGGLVRMVQGMVVHAEFRRQDDLEALFGLLSLETGDFVFTPSTGPTYEVNGREVVDILMLWLSRKDGLG